MISVPMDLDERKAGDKSIWRRFRRNVSISAAGSALYLAIKLGQTALLTRVLRIEDYGRVLIVSSDRKHPRERTVGARSSLIEGTRPALSASDSWR